MSRNSILNSSKQKKNQRCGICLINEKELANITVSDIVNRAKINRTTFYRHYHDKYDLIEQYRNAILNDFKNLAQEYLNSTFVWQDPYSTKMQEIIY